MSITRALTDRLHDEWWKRFGLPSQWRFIYFAQSWRWKPQPSLKYNRFGEAESRPKHDFNLVIPEAIHLTLIELSSAAMAPLLVPHQQPMRQNWPHWQGLPAHRIASIVRVGLRLVTSAVAAATL
jgi:hypothetical protein